MILSLEREAEKSPSAQGSVTNMRCGRVQRGYLLLALVQPLLLKMREQKPESLIDSCRVTHFCKGNLLDYSSASRLQMARDSRGKNKQGKKRHLFPLCLGLEIWTPVWWNQNKVCKEISHGAMSTQCNI